MHDNIDSMLQNLGKTEKIQEDTRRLQDQAQMFDRQARTLKYRERCKNYKLTAAIGFLVLIILIIVIASFAGSAPRAPPPSSPPSASP
jgi:hypothetical protein